MRLLKAALAVATAVLAGSAVLSVPASAAANNSWLNPGEALRSGQRVASADGQYALVMQGDGNLVMYAPGNRAIWATGTNRAGSDVQMQTDGNLVIYTPAPNRVPMWASGTRGSLRLEMQTDGNAVLYTTNGHAAQWSTAGITDRNNIGQVRYNGYVAMRDRGWADSEWSCLQTLWNGESGWRWNARNASSGAYGIPQALPATKLASAGADWRDNPATQISWGLTYIRGVYGTPCTALTRWTQRSPHWY
ncbi:hypothetical protein [Actinoplanes sp. HUAS TT8]|uniref:aggregation-promoting factor C-terminal-like domain-containing protein n=1 Tax=Actinoplanes sp. HUAS TT8 TaxID=3447453 RepID=UPI003F51DF12